MRTRSHSIAASDALSTRAAHGAVKISAHSTERSKDITAKHDEMEAATTSIVEVHESTMSGAVKTKTDEMRKEMTGVAGEVQKVADRGGKLAKKTTSKSANKGADRYDRKEKDSDTHVKKTLS
jgi:hypothetical protein